MKQILRTGANGPQEARRIGGQLADAVAKKTMLEIALSYDNLGKSAQTDTAAEQ